jgi:4-hydroxybenzoate polyprenyltransferase
VPNIPNIGPRGQQMRLRAGLIALAVAIVLAAGFAALGTSPAWRLALFPVLWIAGLGLFQAREKT